MELCHHSIWNGSALNSRECGFPIAILHMDDVYSNAFVATIRERVEYYNSQKEDPVGQLYVESIPLRTAGDDIPAQITKLKKMNFQTIFAVLPFIDEALHNEIMEEAYDQGIAGSGEHVWFFTAESVYAIFFSEYQKDSKLYKAYIGSGAIWSGSERGPEYTIFVKELMALKNSTEAMSYMKAVLPRTHGVNQTDIEEGLRSPYFLDPLVLDSRVQFLYEATVLLVRTRELINSLSFPGPCCILVFSA